MSTILKIKMKHEEQVLKFKCENIKTGNQIDIIIFTEAGSWVQQASNCWSFKREWQIINVQVNMVKNGSPRQSALLTASTLRTQAGHASANPSRWQRRQCGKAPKASARWPRATRPRCEVAHSARPVRWVGQSECSGAGSAPRRPPSRRCLRG